MLKEHTQGQSASVMEPASETVLSLLIQLLKLQNIKEEKKKGTPKCYELLLLTFCSDSKNVHLHLHLYLQLNS